MVYPSYLTVFRLLIVCQQVLKIFLLRFFFFISVIETLLSLFSQKLLIEQIMEWIFQLPIF